MNKSHEKLDKSDKRLRWGNPVGMEDGVKEIIVRFCGFELFNTRPYHNYETWSDGYIVVWRRDGKVMDWGEIGTAVFNRNNKESPYDSVSGEDLDEAVDKYLKKSARIEKVESREKALRDRKEKFKTTENKLKERKIFQGK